MKKLFYIRNTKNDQNFDTVEMRFYPSSWNPVLEYDNEYLQSLIDSDSIKFENCIVEEVEINE